MLGMEAIMIRRIINRLVGHLQRKEMPLPAPVLVVTKGDTERVVRNARWESARRELIGTFSVRAMLIAVGHVACFALSYWLAFSVRFDFDLGPMPWGLYMQSLPWVLGVKTAVFSFLGHYRGWWRYVTFADLVALLRASVVSLLVVLACGYFALDVHIPRGVLLLDLVFTIGVLGSFRSSFRIFREHLLPILQPKEGRWTLLVGTDDASGVLAHQIQSQPDLPYRICGLLDTNGRPGKRQLGRIPVLGHVDNVGEIAAVYRATDVLISAETLTGNRFRQLMEACVQAGVNLRIIPALEDRLSGDHQIPIRSIEINDLLRRDPVVLDHEAIGRLIEGRVVLVTGAGGSIGSEICRQTLRFRPQRLVLVGRGENRIFVIERELRARAGGTEIVSRIGDVTDAVRIQHLFEEFRPQVVFHAAAHKHVPLMEDNPGEAVKNNILGTKVVADAAHGLGVECFVLISTDKAVRPTSVMGATKHMAERYVLALAEESKTRFVVTRFGNVLGSAGSVVPIFQEQIRRGGPITVTDERMTRYFMTIPEASQLVLQAATMGRGGEIFVLDMGEPVRIVDLARDMIRLSGLTEDAIEIVFTGIRPGEKLYEELYFEDEETLPTPHAKLRAAYHRSYAMAEIRGELADLVDAADRQDVCVSSRLRRCVPEFAPTCNCPECVRRHETSAKAHRRKGTKVAHE